mgnify:CR=1 FL=1
MIKKFFSVFLLCLLACVTVSQNAPAPPSFSASSEPPSVSSGTPNPALTATAPSVSAGNAENKKDYIKWVDFNVTYEALKDAMEMDIETFEQDLHLPWTESLAYLASRNGGDFSGYQKNDLKTFAEKRLSGSSVSDLIQGYKVYDYYYSAYSAVIGNLLGFREDGTYGLTAFSPIAAGYLYTESDDFGNGRSYGFARKHLGHDMFCSVGTPVAAVENGVVEAMGWNQYGGWRIGIRSLDRQRYYYYAHLRKDAPFAKGLKEGSRVRAGQIIGYTGQSGYSIKENVNNINVPHLHFGIQLIFDESQKECLSEIWIDTYPLIQLLSANRAKASGVKGTMPAAADIPVSENAARTPNGSMPDRNAAGTPNSSMPGSHTSSSAAQKDKAEVNLPILMYHGLTDRQSRVGDYYVPAETFESDMRYLKEQGYTSVTMTELIHYVYDKSGSLRLPEKPVIITFDDGYLNNHTFGTEILKEYGMKAVISVIGSASREMSQTKYRNERSCAANISELRQMKESGVWEIQNHTYNLHKITSERRGASKEPRETPSDYLKRLQGDLYRNQLFLKSVTGAAPNTFTWPYGAYTEDARALLKEMNFRATLSCASGINRIKKGDTDCLYLLKRNIRKPDFDFSKLLSEH